MKEKKKNPLFEKELKSPVKGQVYNDTDNPDRPKKIANPPFYQLYKGASFDFLREKMNANPSAMAVWWELINLMDNQGAVMISQSSLATFFGKTTRTIRNWIDWLDEEELIHIFKVGTANVYVINASIISDQLLTKKQNFSLFNARVIADKKEQTSKIKRKFFSVAGSVPAQIDLIEQIKEMENNGGNR